MPLKKQIMESSPSWFMAQSWKDCIRKDQEFESLTLRFDFSFSLIDNLFIYLKISNMNKSALIVVDVQNFFVNENTKDIPNKISTYIDHNEFDFLAFSKFVNNENSNYFKLLNWKKCTNSPDTDIHNKLVKFINNDNVFEKASYSIFKAKNFTDFLKNNQITKLYFCGIDTDACILASAYDAFDLGFDFEIITDLCFSHSGEKFNTAANDIINKNLRLKKI